MSGQRNIVSALRRIRLARRLSQENVSECIGMRSQSGLSMLEAGRRSPTLETLTKWANALGCEIVLQERSQK